MDKPTLKSMTTVVKKVQNILNNEDTNRVVNESEDLTALLMGLFGLAITAIARK
jgi:hypothetical protein